MGARKLGSQEGAKLICDFQCRVAVHVELGLGLNKTASVYEFLS